VELNRARLRVKISVRERKIVSLNRSEGCMKTPRFQNFSSIMAEAMRGEKKKKVMISLRYGCDFFLHTFVYSTPSHILQFAFTFFTKPLIKSICKLEFIYNSTIQIDLSSKFLKKLREVSSKLFSVLDGRFCTFMQFYPKFS
jgi:hypothetical protein